MHHMKARIPLVGTSIASIVLCTGCATTKVGPGELFTFDSLNSALAAKVLSRIVPPGTPYNDFIVTVSNSRDPIGTIYRENSSIPITFSACKPLSEPSPVPAFYFPSSYKLTKEAAASLGLDKVFSTLGSLGIDVSNAKGVDLSFNSVSQQTMADDEVSSVTFTDACRQVIQGRNVVIVRGYINAKRDFGATATNKIDIRVSATKVGTLVVKPIGNSTAIKIQDEAPAGFLQVLQRITGPAVSQETPRSSLDAPSAPKGTVYIQVDASDNSGVAKQVSTQLRRASFSVPDGIETIPGSRMPLVTQIRYFNESDKKSALALTQLVRAFRPNAVIVRLGIPAPLGQMEVWLTKE